jgi:NAD(P)H-dependent FMN reductase
MKKLLVVLSSVRESRTTDQILKLVQSEIKKYPDFDVEVADFKKMPLPFFDSALTPSNEDFAPADKNVKKWTAMVDESDAVLVLTAEYNHSYPPVLKNAIDWVYAPWDQKPIAMIGHGWVGAARSIKHLRDVFASNINARALEREANLRFMKEIDTEGNPLNGDAVKEIDAVLNELQELFADTAKVGVAESVA